MEPIWTRAFRFVTLGTLFLFIAFYMLYPTMPLFITQMGGSQADVGLAMGAFMFSAVLLRPFIGWLVDRFGRRVFVVAGLLLFTLAMYLYTWVGGMAALIGLRIFHGMAWAICTTAVLTSITDIIPASRRGEGLGWFSMSTTVAMAVGPMIGLWVAQNLSYQALFLVAVGLSCAAFLLMFWVRTPFRPRRGSFVLFELSVLPATIAVLFVFVAYGGITTFVPLFAASIGVNAGLFFLVYAATLFLIRPIAGRLSDSRGETFVLVPALALTIVSLLVLGFSTNLLGVLFAAVLYGIGFGSAMPVLQAITLRFAQPERIGVANASFTTATDLGIGLGAMLLGWVSQYASSQAVFVASALSVAVGLVVFLLVVRRLLVNTGQAGVPADSAA